ncbi:MAG: hypothetical protein J6R40_03820, partial [Clostridia bacterium]|nr:hypothetical protein [Clostridia bacterium]
MTKTKKALCASGAFAFVLAAVILFLHLFGGLRVQAKELSKPYKSEIAPPQSYTDAFKTSAADFSFALYRAAASQNGENTLLSPLS